MNFRVIKLDRRHTGYTQWQFFIERTYSMRPLEASKMFYLWREWCWEQWGASKELNNYNDDDLFNKDYSSNPHWCWLNDGTRSPRIYLRTDTEASMFTLRWL